jgi:hypothetical protein
VANDETMVLGEPDPMTGYHEIELEPLKIPKKKVCSLSPMKFTSHDYVDAK